MMKGTEKGTFSAMTLFAWLAIGVGIGAMSSLLSVMYGFESSLKDRVLKAYPHLLIRSKVSSHPIAGYEDWTKRLRAVAGVTRAVPYIETEMIVQSERRALGAVVWGLPEEEMAQRKDSLVNGTLPSKSSRLPQVVVGSELAARLSLSVGDPVIILSPLGKTGPMGMVPQSESFEVSGLYTSGHYEFDQQYLFLPLEDAQDLVKHGNTISGWQVWATSLEAADEVQGEVEKIIPTTWEAQSWTVFNSSLFQSLKLEQYAMFTILSFAILIAVMNIVITLMMHVTHKKKNIGVLRALGASRVDIRNLFIWQGALLGGMGLVLGAFLTVAILGAIRFLSPELPDIYYDRSIPFEIRPFSLGLVYGVAIVMIFIATIYPAYRAAELDPIEAIREG
jgi:lipoprotein-releasing system permease protein